MRRLFLTGFLVAAALPLLAAETVSTISFNPSRLGQYTYLKINKDINLKGGLQVSDQTHLNSPASDTGELVFATSNGGSINITSVGGVLMEIPNLTSKSNATAGVNVYMPNAVFQKSASALVDNVEMSGGSINMSNGTDASTITTLSNTAGGMIVNASETLLARANMTISGTTWDGWTPRGITLGNIRVPKPSITFAKYCWKYLEGVEGRLKVFALCTTSDTDYAVGTDTPTYAWKTSGTSAGIVNFSTSDHSVGNVNYWLAQYNEETREGNSGSTMNESNMGGTNSGYLARIVQGAFGGSSVSSVCKDMFSGINLSMVTTTRPSGSCSTKGDKKVYGSTNYSSFRNTLVCELLECK